MAKKNLENKISEEELREAINVVDELDKEKDINKRLKKAIGLPGPGSYSSYMEIHYGFGVNCYKVKGDGYAYISAPWELKLPYFISPSFLPHELSEDRGEVVEKNWNSRFVNMFAMEVASNKPIEEIIEEIEGYHEIPVPVGRYYLGPDLVIEPDSSQDNYKCCEGGVVWAHITITGAAKNKPIEEKELEDYKEFIAPYKKEIEKIKKNRKGMLTEIGKNKNAQEIFSLLKSAKITDYKIEYPSVYVEGKPILKIFGLKLPSLRKERILEITPKVREVEVEYHNKLDSNEIESIVNFLKPIAEKYEFNKVIQISLENKSKNK